MYKTLAVLSLLAGCSATPTIKTYNAHGAHLTIVVPTAWKGSLTGYIANKRDDGFVVDVLNAEDEAMPGVLHDDLVKAKSDYVFLVGDFSIIPTVYDCERIAWSTVFGKSCTYSDSYLTDGAGVVGRLVTSFQGDLDTYVLKAEAYRGHTPSRRVYLINDRFADADDATQLGVQTSLKQAGIDAKLDAVNMDVNPTLRDDASEAEPADLDYAVDQEDDLIAYYGHGSSEYWGYLGNLWRGNLTPAVGSIVPVAFAMGCETARSAPNAPWYPYYDKSNNLVNLATNMFWAFEAIPDPNPIQPEAVNDPSWGKRFTSDLPSGSMVYIGETVVTGGEPALLSAWYENFIAAYKGEPQTVGSMWKSAAKWGHPEIWQFVGDPSTWFIN